MEESSLKTKIMLNAAKLVLQIMLNVIFYVLVVLIIVKISNAAYNYAYQLYGNVAMESFPGNNVKVEIKEGESVAQIAEKLSAKKIVINKFTFLVRAKISTGTNLPILPGTYTLNTSMNYNEIMDMLTGVDEEKEEAALSQYR